MNQVDSVTKVPESPIALPESDPASSAEDDRPELTAEELEQLATMKEKLDHEKRALKQELDEMKVHLVLGAADAVDYLEKKKTKFSEFVDEMKDEVSKITSPTTHTLKTNLDHLQVQLALGKMESRDAYHTQRKKIVDAIDEIHDDMEKLVKEGQSELRVLRVTFTNQASIFQTNLESAAINLGAEALVTSHEIGDSVEKVDDWLANLASMTLDEIKEARRYIQGRVALHSKKNHT